MSQKISDKRLFDEDGNLVVGVGQPIPEGVSGLKALDVSPADPLYVAGHPDDSEPDPVDAPAHAPVTEVPLYTPAEQQLVNDGLMPERTVGALSNGPAEAKKATPKKATA